MNFQTSDFLNELNLGLDHPSALSDGFSQSDLDLFSQAEFFDLDAFSKEKPVDANLFPVPTQNNQYSESINSESSVIKSEPTFDRFVEPSVSPLQSPESSSPAASATQDKRKRNTAASARFRIKKKMKEQEMQRKSKELQEKLASLEKKLKTLEMENKCLKNLILEQNEQKNSDLLETIKRRSILDSKPVFQYSN